MNISNQIKDQNVLLVKRIGIDTYRKPIIYMRADCHICRSEGFEALSRVKIEIKDRSLIATLNIVKNDLLQHGEIGLSEAVWSSLNPEENDSAYLSHPAPLQSMSHVRSKIYGHTLSKYQLDHIMQDIVSGSYDESHLSAFITACAGNRLNLDEIISLTKSMIDSGSRLSWDQEMIVDKHCVGGLPGNRTTLIIVPIIAAFGLLMPKTSSRAITSPAGTADTMETLAPVNLSLEKMKEVVYQQGGCIVWGGNVNLSPADDILISIERKLDIDSEGQLIASVLSKKVAAGSSHVLIDLPVGETAKIRSMNIARQLGDMMIAVGSEVGLNVKIKVTDGQQPVGRGIGPALEARDVLAVLHGNSEELEDLRERSLTLAGELLELSGRVSEGSGYKEAKSIVDSGRALQKFESICEAQGGLREPPVAKYQHEVLAKSTGIVLAIDNRRLSMAAKLAGAPLDSASGIYLNVKNGTKVEKGESLFTLHAESAGELSYALDYINGEENIITVTHHNE